MTQVICLLQKYLDKHEMEINTGSLHEQMKYNLSISYGEPRDRQYLLLSKNCRFYQKLYLAE